MGDLILIPEDELRDIPGYEGLYAASHGGRIYSIRRQKWLAPASNRGYQVVTICAHGKQKVCKVHRLVAFAWIPNPTGLPEVNHMNGIKSANHVPNLEWANASSQQLHARKLGLAKTTDAMRAASSKNIRNAGKKARKLSAEQAAEVRVSRLSCIQAARAYGVSSSAIHAIRKGKTYAE